MSVVVIGGGAAGILAAVAAKRAGASDVVVVRHAGGATALSSGGVDVADQERELTPGSERDPFEHGGRLSDAVAWTAARFPRHPYAVIGERGRARLEESLSLLQEVARDVALRRRSDEKNLIGVTQLGTIKRTALLQDALAYDVGDGAEHHIALVELADLAGYDAPALERTLAWVGAMSHKPITLSVVRLPRLLSGDVVDDPAALAARFEADGETLAQSLASLLKEAVQERAPTCTSVLLPPVLPLTATTTWIEALRAQLGRPVHEVLALPPSPPGQRLARALQAGAVREGITIRQGRILSADVDDERVRRLVLKQAESEETLEPSAVVLATGRFLAGGLVRDRSAWEPIFGLPVITDGQEVADQFIGAFTEERPDGAHLIFRAGIAVDDALRPLKARRTLVAKNLFAAGSVLEGYDPARDGSGLGVAALTGLLAGEAAARLAALPTEPKG